jgi:uncharacterized protein (DUF58 family)
VVKHNVDTSQPYTVVLFDQRPGAYTEEAFEEAVDVTASVIMCSAANKAPLELRLTDGTVIGGPRLREVTRLIDHLTGVQAHADGTLQALRMALRRSRGGTSFVLVTGVLDHDELPYVSALRRRFDRLVVVSIDPDRTPAPHFDGVRIIVAADADEACAAWNLQVHTA